MAFEKSCPECHGLMGASDVAASTKETCAHCGAHVVPVIFDPNPYSAPLARPTPNDDPLGARPAVRTSVFGKFAEAFRLLASNLPLFSLIVLTIWIPGNLLVGYAAQHGGADPAVSHFKLNSLIEGVFGPIYGGALIYALSRRKEGLRVGYSEAMAVGLRRWGSLWGTRLVAGILILLGLLAAVLPGIILMIRYALVDPIVVLEGVGGAQARRRSRELAVGWKVQIFTAGLIFFPSFLIASLCVGGVAEYLELSENFWASIVLDSCMDILMTILMIVLFLVYWEAVHLEHPAEKPAPAVNDPD